MSHSKNALFPPWHPITLWLVLAFAVVMCGNAGAQSTNAATLSSSLPDVGASLVRVVGALAVVFAVFFGGIWCFRNWQRLTVNRRAPAQVRVLEVKPLGNRQVLYLVACREQMLLLGSSAAGLTTLCKMPEDSGSAHVKPLAVEECAEQPFARNLRAVLSRES